MEQTISANRATKYVIQENSNSTSASVHQMDRARPPHGAWTTRPVQVPGRRSCRQSVMQDATQRMTPVDMGCTRFHALPMLLENFVREQENDDDEGDDQKRAQYYVLDHDNLLVVKRLRVHCSRKATACTAGEY